MVLAEGGGQGGGAMRGSGGRRRFVAVVVVVVVLVAEGAVPSSALVVVVGKRPREAGCDETAGSRRSPHVIAASSSRRFALFPSAAHRLPSLLKAGVAFVAKMGPAP